MIHRKPCAHRSTWTLVVAAGPLGGARNSPPAAEHAQPEESDLRHRRDAGTDSGKGSADAEEGSDSAVCTPACSYDGSVGNGLAGPGKIGFPLMDDLLAYA